MSFSPTVFGVDLARVLDVLIAIQADESKRFNRQEHMPLLGIFTNPSGTWFEADMLTRHFYAGQMALDVALARDAVPGAREAFEWQQQEGAGITMLQVRQLLLMRYVEMAASMQTGAGHALPTVRAAATHPARPRDGSEWEVGRWALRPSTPQYGMLWPSDARPPPQDEQPPGMQPAWTGPVMMAIPSVQPQRPPSARWPSTRPQAPRAPVAQFVPTARPLPVQPAPPAQAVPLSPSEPASSVHASPPPSVPRTPESLPDADRQRGSVEPAPQPASLEPPRPPPRRGPGWLMQDSDMSMQSSPASPSYSEQSRQLGAPSLLATPWFPQPPP